jgi:hypothetical protein
MEEEPPAKEYSGLWKLERARKQIILCSLENNAPLLTPRPFGLWKYRAVR